MKALLEKGQWRVIATLLSVVTVEAASVAYIYISPFVAMDDVILSFGLGT